MMKTLWVTLMPEMMKTSSSKLLGYALPVLKLYHLIGTSLRPNLDSFRCVCLAVV